MAEHQDYQTTEAIENRADELMIDFLHATKWPPTTSAEERAHSIGFTLLAVEDYGGRTVGFAQVTEADESAHLEQIAVLPEFGRLGYGRQLVHAAADEARRRGYPQITLSGAKTAKDRTPALLVRAIHGACSRPVSGSCGGSR